MGTPLPYYEPGDPCGRCWGPGGPLGPEPTPKYIFAHFVDWTEGPAWWEGYRAILETEQRLTQHLVACRWALWRGWSYWNLNWAVPPASLVVVDWNFAWLTAFSNTWAPFCSLEIPNLNAGGMNDITVGGQINLRFQPEA